MLMASMSLSLCQIWADSRTFKVNKRYLNIPVSYSQDKHYMTFTTDKGESLSVAIRLAADKPDYWVFRDLSALKGKQLTVSYEVDGMEGLQKIYLADTLEEQAAFYKEKYRPQYHFTTRRGWNNDPNGLVYYEGEYHLFYQYNPYEREWGNMHWGHAVSKDLLHWQELPLVLEPDHFGTMYSGSAVIDYENTSGFGKKGKPAMVALYTVDSAEKEIQCAAYSLDNGRTFTKYEGNPVLDSSERWKDHGLRDPKVFWYAPGKHWVMALYEKDGVSIYNSQNLKDWTYRSHIPGFYECPDLIELPVDGNSNNRKWVLMGASETYMIGSFDGKTFTPEAGKFVYSSGRIYAAQTYSNINDRVVQIGWGRITHPGMPFKSMMQIPTELSLVTTHNGIRLKSYPVKEIASLKTSLGHWNDLSAADATKLLKSFASEDGLCIKAKIHSTSSSGSFCLQRNGQNVIDYDYNHNRLNGFAYSSPKLTPLDMEVEVYMDRTSYEVFVDEGFYAYSMERKVSGTDDEGFVIPNNKIEVKELEVYRVQSIWK